MELDNLKEIWSKDNILEIPQISIQKQKEIHLPLEKIRQNMRLEFWSNITIFIAALSLSWFTDLPFKFKFYITMVVFSMVLVTSFFFLQFFKLYKEIGNTSLKTYDSLKDLQNQFNLNKQYYISFYVSFIPFIVAEMIIIQEFSPSLKLLSDVNMAISFTVFVTVGLITLYLLGKYWFKLFYGIHIKKIDGLMKELT